MLAGFALVCIPRSLLCQRRPGLTITAEISAAGDWLREHNEGGHIMVSPRLNQIPSRMFFAMGEYPAMQSYASETILKDRNLPPGGADVLWVRKNPGDKRALRMLRDHDVRYVVIHKNMPDSPPRTTGVPLGLTPTSTA